MADMAIGELPRAYPVGNFPPIPELYDDDYIPVEHQGVASRMTGKQFADFGRQSAAEYVEGAKESASQAAESAEKAQAAEQGAAESLAKLDNQVELAEAAREGAESAQAEVQRLAQETESNKESTDASAAAAANSERAAEESANTALQAKLDSESAQADAKASKEAAEHYSTSAGESAKSAQESADTAKAYSGNPPIIQDGLWYTWDADTGEYKNTQKPAQGERGEAGTSLEEIRLKNGNHAAGTTDTYEAVLTDGTVGGTFEVYNGKDGAGSGDMEASVYDPKGNRKDIFAELDGKVSKSGDTMTGALTVKAGEETVYPPEVEDKYTRLVFPSVYIADNADFNTKPDEYNPVVRFIGSWMTAPVTLRNIQDPTQNNDAATKAYVDKNASKPKYYTGEVVCFYSFGSNGELVLSGMPEEYSEDKYLVMVAPKTAADMSLWREHGVYLKEIQNIGATDWALKFDYIGNDLGSDVSFTINVSVVVQRMEAGA